MNSLDKVKKIVTLADNKKAYDIEVIEVAGVTSITDYFVICTGNSDTQVMAIADEIEYKLKEEDNIIPAHIEGYKSASWVLIDYNDVIVHIFLKESRMFYSLERLWADAKRIDIENLISERTGIKVGL